MNFTHRHHQQGAVLLVCLVLLLGLTVVGIASMKETITQQKVINAVAEDDTAFQAAEFALREGEKFIIDYTRTMGQQMNGGETITFNGQTVTVADERLYSSNDRSDNWWKKSKAGDWDDGAQSLDYPRTIDTQQMPSFVIEVLGKDTGSGSVDLNDDRNVVMNYRVTARGYGISSSFYVVLQSTVGIQL